MHAKIKEKKKLNEEDTTIAMPFTLKKECTHNPSHECINRKKKILSLAFRV